MVSDLNDVFHQLWNIAKDLMVDALMNKPLLFTVYLPDADIGIIDMPLLEWCNGDTAPRDIELMTKQEPPTKIT